MQLGGVPTGAMDTKGIGLDSLEYSVLYRQLLKKKKNVTSLFIVFYLIPDTYISPTNLTTPKTVWHVHIEHPQLVAPFLSSNRGPRVRHKHSTAIAGTRYMGD